jgi:cysteine synthase A
MTTNWISDSLAKLQAEASSSGDTRMHSVPLPADWGIDLYVKDESSHPTGSLKHRLAQSLLQWALVSGSINENTVLIEASSGSTAVSEAYFAQLLGLKFIAVMPAGTSRSKIDQIEKYGGSCHLVAAPRTVWDEAERLAAESNTFYLDQFTNAAAVTDWRSDKNIAGSIFRQLSMERYPSPSWIVVGAGTGGTSATIGRYCNHRNKATRLAVADPEGSVFYRAWAEGRTDLVGPGSRIEGVGRPRVERSFVPGVIDEMMSVTDAQSLAAMAFLEELTGLRAGGSTGTNFYYALQLVARMRDAGERGSVVTLMCDSGDRYADTYYSADWISGHGIDTAPSLEELRALFAGVSSGA